MFKNLDEILKSGMLNDIGNTPGTHRVLKNTRLEELVYRDVRSYSPELNDLEEKGLKKLASFPELVQDTFHSLYSINIDFRDEAELSILSRKFNRNILKKVLDSDEYPALKMLTEGRELEAAAAISEFSDKLLDGLDELLKDVSGEKSMLKVLDSIESKCVELKNNLEQMASQLDSLKDSGADTSQLEKKLTDTADRLQSKIQQAQKLNDIVDQNIAKNGDVINTVLTAAVHSAVEKTREVSDILSSWGNGSRQEAKMDAAAVTALTQRVKNSVKLREISKYLGRYREILAKQLKSGYCYGRGEKYDLTLGNDISRLVSSEYAMLAAPEAVPQFIRKYQKKQLKQYRRREPVAMGKGDIIVCLDESNSTLGGKEYWGKALALTLMEAAMKRKSSFALIHFSGRGSIRTEVFRYGKHTPEDVMNAAEVFLDGGTDFETPLNEAMRFINDKTAPFGKADIVFITDGECSVRDSFLQEYRNCKAAKKFRTTGILLDKGEGSFNADTVKKFCDRIYRTSELDEDGIARTVIAGAI